MGVGVLIFFAPRVAAAQARHAARPEDCGPRTVVGVVSGTAGRYGLQSNIYSPWAGPGAKVTLSETGSATSSWTYSADIGVGVSWVIAHASLEVGGSYSQTASSSVSSTVSYVIPKDQSFWGRIMVYNEAAGLEAYKSNFLPSCRVATTDAWEYVPMTHPEQFWGLQMRHGPGSGPTVRWQ